MTIIPEKKLLIEQIENKLSAYQASVDRYVAATDVVIACEGRDSNSTCSSCKIAGTCRKLSDASQAETDKNDAYAALKQYMACYASQINYYLKTNNQNPVTMQELKITVPDGKEAVWRDNVLTLVDKETEKRIETFDEAYKVLDKRSNPLVYDFQSLHGQDAATVAFLQLRMIAEVLNNGWRPTFKRNEDRYYPTFYELPKEALTTFDRDDIRESLRYNTLDQHFYLVEYEHYQEIKDHLSEWYRKPENEISITIYNAAFAVRDAETAVYFGQQFIDIWLNFLLPHAAGVAEE